MPSQDTQARTRRKHEARFKRELIARSLQPGASVSAIALENGINANLLFKWRRMHVRSTSGPRADAVMLPVKVETAAPAPLPSAMPQPRPSNGVIEIDIGAARVRLRGAVDEASVRCVLQALSALA